MIWHYIAELNQTELNNAGLAKSLARRAIMGRAEIAFGSLTGEIASPNVLGASDFASPAMTHLLWLMEPLVTIIAN